MNLQVAVQRMAQSRRSPSAGLPALARPASAEAGSWLLLAIGVVLPVITGMIATTADPILVGMFAGLIFGLPLLLVPILSLWLVLVGTLFAGGMIVQFLPTLTKANWLFSMLGFLLLARALGTRFVNQGSRSQPLAWWAWLALLFPLYAVLVALLNQISVLEFLAGFKRYFQFWGVFAVLAILVVPAHTLRRLIQFLISLALIQLVFAVYQRVVVVPQRVGMGGGVVAIDAVSGTFESSFTGGGSSSVLVFFLLTVFTFILRMWLDGRLKGTLVTMASLLVLAPLALGETKVVVIFLPTALLCALLLDIRHRPFRTLLLALLGLSATAALAALYLFMSTRAGESFQTAFNNIIAYNFGNVGYHSVSGLNRSTVFSFWWSQQHIGNPFGFLLGHGPGSSYQGESNLVPGHLALRYGGLAIGFTTLSSMLWDYGVLGLTLYLLFNIAAVFASAGAAFKLPAGPWRSASVAVVAGLLMNLMMTFLSNATTSLPSQSTLHMLLLGAAVLVWRRAHEVGQPKS